MKNKTSMLYTVVSLAALFLCTSLKSQNFYMGVLAGYGHSAAPNILGSTESSYTENFRTEKRIVGQGSQGRGFIAGIQAGLNLNENVAAEIGVSHLTGFKSTSKYSMTGNSYYHTMTSEMSATMWRIAPVIKLSHGNDDMRLYMKAGPVIGFGSKMINTDNYSSTYSFSTYTESSEMVTEFSGGASLGFTVTLGGSASLGEHLDLFVELCGITQSWGPNKSVLTRDIENGQDVLSQLTVSEKETNYSNHFEEKDTPDENKPAQELKFFIPFSSIGLNMGINIKF